MKSLKEILTFSAFKPEVEDPKYSLAQRLRGRAAVFANIGSVTAKVGVVVFDQKGVEAMRDVEVVRMTGQDNEIDLIRKRANQYETDAVVLLSGQEGSAFIVNTAMHTSHDLFMEAVNNRISQVIGREPQPDTAYLPVVNPDRESTMVFAVSQKPMKRTINTLNEHGLKVAFAGFAMAGTFDYLVRRDYGLLSHERDLLIVDNTGTFLLRFEDGDWTQVSCRTDVQANPNESHLERVLSRDGSFERGVDFICSTEFALGEWLRRRHPETKFTHLYQGKTDVDFWIGAQG
jgi:hypothetical protein